jgi:hypothetical protein
MRRSRIDEILLKEGLRWRRQEPWFGERVDPAFAEKGADPGLRLIRPDCLAWATNGRLCRV